MKNICKNCDQAEGAMCGKCSNKFHMLKVVLISVAIFFVGVCVGTQVGKDKVYHKMTKSYSESHVGAAMHKMDRMMKSDDDAMMMEKEDAMMEKEDGDVMMEKTEG